MNKNNINMSVTTLLILILIGLLTGALAGMLGIGGAIIMVPALVFIMGFGQHLAQGTSLAVMLPPIGIIAAYNYFKAGQVNLKFAVILAIAFVVGSYFGSKYALTLPQPVLKKIFGALLLLVAIRMLFAK
ncbi:MAG: sulfite exporter TauE/SafE family protein [Bacteroidales bacterium]|nr:sulfite exporter TauE/SafE family protein [Bacteroidales bacterium]